MTVKKKAAPKKRGPKPKTLTDKELDQLEALAAALSSEQIADYFGIGRTTFYDMMDREPAISERYKKGRARSIAGVAGNLITQARNGNTSAAIFYLKTQAGWRETEPEKESDDAPSLNISFSVKEPAGEIKVTHGTNT